MENFCKGLVWGAVIGMCVGGIVVAKNRKLAGKIREKMTTAEEKLEEAKETLVDKLQQCDCGSGTESKSCCDEVKYTGNVTSETNFNKKSKN